MKMYVDEELEDWAIGWLASDGKTPRDFSIGWTFKIEYLSQRRGVKLGEKTAGIIGYGPNVIPNIVVTWQVNDLAPYAGKKVQLRLVARRTGDSADESFRKGNYPVLEVIPAPVVATP